MSEEIIQDAITLRRHLHKHPEISGQEKNTSEHLYNKLTECQPDELIRFDLYGLAAVYHGKKPGKTLLIRGDFDALPIEEVNKISYRSVNEGVSHMCGHDGHAAILYALARKLSITRPDRGKTILLFQPAEENGEGAKGMINDPAFKRLTPDRAVALHNLPGFPLHSVVWRTGYFTAAANSIIITLRGKTSHAAEPEKGINPAVAMAEITQALAALNQPDTERKDFRIATPVFMYMGERSYGVSAGYGELHFTLRAWDNGVIRQFEEECEVEAGRIAGEHQLKVEIGWTQSFFANQNDKTLVDAVKRTAGHNSLELIERKIPFKWGEDFGIFTEKFSGAMFGLGAGENTPALHNPDYNFPDELIRTGLTMFEGLINELQ